MPIFLADSNFLGNPELTNYLKASRSNKIAISQHMLVEMHKDEPQINVVRSLSRAREYPNQIVLLRQVVDLYHIRLSSGATILSRAIDHEQSKHFAQWYDDVVNAKNVPSVKTHLEERQSDSQSLIADFASEAHLLEPTLKEMRNKFTNYELREIRGGLLKNRTTQMKLIDMMYDMSKDMFHRVKVSLRSQPIYYRDAPNYFLFRYSMAIIMFFIMYVETGSLTRDKDRLVNHIIDLHVAAEATFFHGILTNDLMLREVHQQSRVLLNRLGAHMFTMRSGSFVYGT